MVLTTEAIESRFRGVQDRICNFLREASGQDYHEDRWEYGRGTGGGITRVWESAFDTVPVSCVGGGETDLLQSAAVLEKGGVNFSAIHGDSLAPAAATKFSIPEGTPFVATGVSIVIHPQNPNAPTIHMNIRYFEAGEKWWFGGGIDLTPNYPCEAFCAHFHRVLKRVCEEYGEDFATHKATCDDYFTINHRNEMRGVGGVFVDHLCTNKERNFEFIAALGDAFCEAYEPALCRGAVIPFTLSQREFQLWRRSRYVEFNLVYDRGTKFGLQSGGRIESIMMSMPREAMWLYDYAPPAGSVEHSFMQTFLQPRDWAGAPVDASAPVYGEDTAVEQKASPCCGRCPCPHMKTAGTHALAALVGATIAWILVRRNA